jgi:TrmH family RNA methyltransferase
MTPMSDGLSHHVVLVRPIYPRNVGAVSRAMANMGAGRLILIAPACAIDHEARQGAAGAQTRLLEANVYSSWEEFYSAEPEGLRIAFSGKIKRDSDDLDYAAGLKKDSALVAATKPVYFIFGPEDQGLSNEDSQYANFIYRLPTFGEFSSLNLAQAVLLALYITRQELQAATVEESTESSEHFSFPEKSLKDWLEVLGFELGDRRSDAYQVIKRILLKNIATAKELRVLAAVVNQTVRKLTGKN